MEERIVELEIRAAHQEKLLDDLNEVLHAFTARVESLEHQLADLRESAGTSSIGPADDPPPHY